MRRSHIYFLSLVAVAVIVFLSFILWHEEKYKQDHKHTVEKHSKVVAASVWFMSTEFSKQYLEMVVKHRKHAQFDIYSVESPSPIISLSYRLTDPFEKTLFSLGLISIISDATPIFYEDEKIGRILVKTYNFSIYTYANLLVLLGMLLMIAWFILKIAEERGSLKIRVAEKTQHLEESNQQLMSEIKERLKAEEDLRHSQQTFSSIVEGMQDAYIQTDTEGIILMVNQSAVRLYGYPDKEAMLGLSIKELYWNLDERDPMLSKLKNTGKVENYELNMKSYSGEPLVCLCNLQIIKTVKGDTAMECLIRNFGERKKAEERIRFLQSYLSNIINSMPNSLISIDHENKITHLNDSASAEFGLPDAEAQGRPLTELDSRFELLKPHIHQAIEKRQPIYMRQMQYIRNDTTLYEDIQIYPLNEEGINEVVLLLTDVTDKVRLEEAMVQSEKMLSLGGLAAGMAHEINNPLAIITQSSQNMKNRLLKPLPHNIEAAEQVGVSFDQIKEYFKIRKIDSMLEGISEASIRSAEIIKNMLGFARQSSSVQSECSIADILDKSIELALNDYNLKKQYDFRQIEIIKNYTANPFLLKCEPSRLQQVFLNILRNGAEAMNDKAYEEGEKPAFTISLEQVGKKIIIHIEDNGPGISEQIRKKIFEPFFTTKPVGQGTGLGMSISYFIITESHKGELTVDSEKGHWTRFTITLPGL